MHISRISRENEKWFCERFLARNTAREIARKIGRFFGHFGPQFGQNSSNFQCRVTQIELKVLHLFISYDFVNF